jgi:hypothetical protein
MPMRFLQLLEWHKKADGQEKQLICVTVITTIVAWWIKASLLFEAPRWSKYTTKFSSHITGAQRVPVLTNTHFFIRGGAGKSLARPTSRCRRTESIVSLERGVCLCDELQVFSCYRIYFVTNTHSECLMLIAFPTETMAARTRASV